MRQRALAVAVLVAACDLPQPRPYDSRSVGPGPAATIVANAGSTGGDAFHVVEVEVYRYEHGCPDLSARASRGYKGFFVIGSDTREFTVPAGRRIVLKGGYSNNFMSCWAALSFRPDDGATYLFKYWEPAKTDCAVSAVQLVRPRAPEEKPTLEKIDSLVGIRLKMGLSGYATEQLCALPP